MFVVTRFKLKKEYEEKIRSIAPNFGYNGYGEFLFYRTYSRNINGRQENWNDCILRNINGTFSIRKDWYTKNHISWDESYWQDYALAFGLSLVQMYWMPPGRGFFHMGTEFTYSRGSMALYSCAYTDITDDFEDDIDWAMDALMNGVGVGFGPIRNDRMELKSPRGRFDFIIEDSREGWTASERALLYAYKTGGPMPRFIYDKIRSKGKIIHGFGGVSSGPESLMDLHKGTIESCECFRQNKSYDSVRFKADVMNKTGCCVVAGNVRRSAELCCGPIDDPTLLDLKDYEKFPDREAYGWMSNNAGILEKDEDFLKLGEIARRATIKGEVPGIINKQNFKYGRLGKVKDINRIDYAVGFNPCGEIPLEHREVCNIAETCPTVCPTVEDWYKACEYATFYMSTVSLLPTHQPSTNRVVARNRRIGCSIIDISGWKLLGVHRVTEYMRQGYQIVCRTNQTLNAEAGVPEAIRKTTVKPGGTTPKLPGKTSGIGNPTFDFTIRRTRVQEDSAMDKALSTAGYPREHDVVSKNTVIFEMPIYQGPAKPASQVSLWEQAMNVVWAQREWSDNAVSNTLYFIPEWGKIDEITSDFEIKLAVYTDEEDFSVGLAKDLIDERRDVYTTDTYRFTFRYRGNDLIKIDIYQYNANHEENDIEPMLSAVAPMIKSLILLPHTGKGAYPQMPEEECTRDEYLERLQNMGKIDWSKYCGVDGTDEKYCSGEVCELAS